MLADFLFLVAAALCSFGEWCYPVMVFTFIAALFTVTISPIIVRFSKKRDVPQNDDVRTENFIRAKVNAINMARRNGHAVLTEVLAAISVPLLAIATYYLGKYVNLALGFAGMVLMLATPLLIVGLHSSAQTKKFFTVKNGEKLVDIYHPEDIKALYNANPKVIIGIGDPPSALLNFFYNWLSYYLKNERLALYRVPAPELCRDFTPANFLSYDDVLFCIPEEQLDLMKEKLALYRRECDIIQAIPFSFCVAEENVGIEE